MKNVILIAAPAAGKGTEALKLKEQFHMPHISTGDLLRNVRNTDSKFAKVIADYQDRGELVPFEIVLDLLKERILQPDCDNGYILDGFPRDLKQAKAYDEILNEINRDLGYVIVLDIDKEIAKARISGRYTCPKCGKIYNINNIEMKPEKDGLCDICDVELTHRSDDDPEVYEQRYQSYLTNTEPIVDYYNAKGAVYHVNAGISVEETHRQVVEILGE